LPVPSTVACAPPPGPFPADLRVTVLKRGPWFKADILRFQHDGGALILKDFSSKSRLMRWFGRRQLRREQRALHRLRGLEGFPKVLGVVPPCALLLEPMHGGAITRFRRRREEDKAPMLDRLNRLVEAMHARGVAHLDLRKRDNILVTEAGDPSIIDFNASIALEPASIAARLFFPILRDVDRGALLKWRHFLLPERLSESERRRVRRQSRLRRLWIFS
jgi:serine/threonine protein kinase